MRKESINSRKQETRQKIIMGGLVAKAGLSDLHQTNPEVILGILLEAKEKLADNSSKEFANWRALGLKEMSNKQT